MREETFQREYRGYAIEARVTWLDDGIHILVTGGCRTHVGAISYGLPGDEVWTVQFPGHRDDVISEEWARAFRERYVCPVVVSCGVHYDGVSKSEIGEIIQASRELLAETLAGNEA